MRKRWMFVLALTALLAGMLALAVPGSGAPQPPVDRPTPAPLDQPPAFVEGQILVSFKPALLAQERQEFFNARGLKVLDQLDGLDVSVVEAPVGSEQALAESLSSLSTVRYAEPNYIAQAFGTPDDPVFNSQWNLRKINGPAAWDVSAGSPSTIIAIIDTGIDLTHPDLRSKIVAGYDFVNTDTSAQDDHGHGTHCAGIAAAASNNSIGVAGVNWRARLMPVKVLNNQGSGWYSDVAAGIVWAANHGATVISLSLGGSASSTTLSDAVNYAHDRGVIVVAAAGNSYASGNITTYPAALENVMGVAATTTTDAHAYYSNTGFYVDIAAPGGDESRGIYSTFWTSDGPTYASMMGTSMATPHVAGLAALIKSMNSALTPAQIEGVIQSTAVDRGAAGRDDVFGWGRINMLAAINAAVHAGPTPTVNYIARVNCGGVRYVDQAGKAWQSDRAYKAGSWGYVGGAVKVTTAAIAGTLDDPLYQTDRTWNAGGGYRFTVPDGRYEVTLKFAETVWSAANQRKFTVRLEGMTKAANYDIFAVAGAKNKAAPNRVHTVDVTDGELTLDFIHVLDMPKINAIQVKKVTP